MSRKHATASAFGGCRSLMKHRERRLYWMLPASSWSSHCTCQRCKDALKCLLSSRRCFPRSKDRHLQVAVFGVVGVRKSVQRFSTSPASVSGTHRTPAFPPLSQLLNQQFSSFRKFTEYLTITLPIPELSFLKSNKHHVEYLETRDGGVPSPTPIHDSVPTGDRWRFLIQTGRKKEP